MAETPTMSAEQFCSISGYTDRQHRNIAKAGYFPPPYRGKYQTGKCLTGLIKYQREQMLKKNDTLRQEQEATATIRRMEAQLDYDLKLGKYLPKDEVGPALRHVGLHQRAVLLRKYEQELPPKLAGKTTIEALQLIRSVNDEVLQVFSNGIRSWLETPPPGIEETAEPCPQDTP